MARRSWILLALALLAAPVAAEEPAAKDLTAAVDALSKRLDALERRNADLTNQNRALAGQVDRLSRRVAGGGSKPVDAAVAPASTAPLQEGIDAESGVADLPGMEGAVGGPPQAPFGIGGELEAETGVADLPGMEGAAGGGSPSPFGVAGADEELEAETGVADPPGATGGGLSLEQFLVGGYDEEVGEFVVVRARDTQRTPFELRFDLFTQARFQNFAPSRRGWVDAEGERRPIKSVGSVEIPRNFIIFSGFALDPKLQYTAMIFSSTPTAATHYVGWINYHFNRTFDLRVGVWKIPGTREWYESFRWTLGADRLMATTFFRPGFGPGVWLEGEPIDGLNYVAMVADSLDRFGQEIQNAFGTSATFGGTLWYEPTNDYGVGVSDVEFHDRRSFRFGTNLNIARQANQALSAAGAQSLESTPIRLSDGTPLFQPGLFGPGVVVKATNLQLWTVDVAMKRRGFGIYGEYFFRWLDDFQTVGGRAPYDSLFDTGGLLEAGYFLKKSKLEAFGRTSFVTGRFGNGVEYGGGLNWYPRGKRTWRTTAEVLRIERSPAQNLLTGYRAGETGTLFQLQWLTDF